MKIKYTTIATGNMMKFSNVTWTQRPLGSQQSPFSHLLITHSYLCSVLFTRSSKQVLMKTKGIRQAEDECPYPVKTTGVTWWKEEAFSCFHQPTLPESLPLRFSGWPTSDVLQPAQSSRAAPLSFHPATQSAKNRSFMIYFFQTTH